MERKINIFKGNKKCFTVEVGKNGYSHYTGHER